MELIFFWQTQKILLRKNLLSPPYTILEFQYSFLTKFVLGITKPGDLTISDLKTGNFLLHIRDYKQNESDHLQALKDI